MDFTGKVIAVLSPKSGTSKSTGNPWMVQEYVVESNEMYPKKMCFSVFGEDKIKQFNIQQNDEIVVSFDIDANEWQGRWFNSIRAWKVEKATAMDQGSPVPPPAAATPEFNPGQDNDDLPF